MPITLKNTGRTTLTFELPKALIGLHPSLTAGYAQRLKDVVNSQGERGRVVETIQGNPCLTMQPGEVVKDLPDRVLTVPQIKRALRRSPAVLRTMQNPL